MYAAIFSFSVPKLNILSPSKQKVHRCCKLSRYHSVYDFAAIYGVLMHFNLGQLCRFISLFLHLSNVHNHFHGNSDGCQAGVRRGRGGIGNIICELKIVALFHFIVCWWFQKIYVWGHNMKNVFPISDEVKNSHLTLSFSDVGNISWSWFIFSRQCCRVPHHTSRHEQRSVGTFLSSPPVPPAATIIFSDLYCNGPAQGQGYIT